MYIKKCLVRH